MSRRYSTSYSTGKKYRMNGAGYHEWVRDGRPDGHIPPQENGLGAVLIIGGATLIAAAALIKAVAVGGSDQEPLSGAESVAVDAYESQYLGRDGCLTDTRYNILQGGATYEFSDTPGGGRLQIGPASDANETHEEANTPQLIFGVASNGELRATQQTEEVFNALGALGIHCAGN